MSRWAEVVRDGAERDQETLRVLRRLEPLEYPFAFTRRQVRVFSPIVQPLVAPMLGVRQRPSNGWQVAGELVGDDDARLGAGLAVKHPMQETLSSYLIASVLDQDVQHDSVLIDGSPEPLKLPADLERHLVQMPLIAGSHSSSTEPGGVARAEPRAPGPDRLVADDDAALGEQILNVTEAEVETKVQPHGVSDDLGWKAVAPIRRPVSELGDGQQTRLIADPRST